MSAEDAKDTKHVAKATTKEAPKDKKEKKPEPIEEPETGSGAEESEDELDEDESDKKAVRPVNIVVRKRQRCTYKSTGGEQCKHFPLKPTSIGRCAQHKNSKCYKPCSTEGCDGWSRSAGYVCPKCKGRISTKVHQARRDVMREESVRELYKRLGEKIAKELLQKLLGPTEAARWDYKKYSS